MDIYRYVSVDLNSSEKIIQEILASSITPILDSVALFDGNVLSIAFRAPLSSCDQTILQKIVAGYQPNKVPVKEKYISPFTNEWT